MESNDRVGEVVDKYKLVRCIGRGGFGEVYEARHTLVGKRFAVKLLHPEWAKNDTIVQRMLREAQAAAAIGHVNIVETFDFGVTPDNVIYLVMEYLEGRPFDELIDEQGVLDVDLVAAVMLQVLSALAAAHDVNIVHRDLKPENIFIARTRRGGEEVKLLDFGISKVTSLDHESLRLTRTGAILGSPYYMSPEQATGDGEVDMRTDLWAVGVVLYQALTGEYPFSGKNYNQMMFRIATENFVALKAHRPDLPGALDAVVTKALQKKPDERYQTAAEMIDALQPFGPADRGSWKAVLPSRPLGATKTHAIALPTDAATGEAPTLLHEEVADTGEGPGETPVDETMYYNDSGKLFQSSEASAQARAVAQPAEDGALTGSETMSPGQVVGRLSAVFRRGLSRGAKIAIGAGSAGLALMVAIILFLAIDDDGDRRAGAKETATPMRVVKAPVGTDAAARDPRIAFVDAMSPRPRSPQRIDAAVQVMRPPPPPPPPLRRIPKMVVHLQGLPRRARVKLDGKLTDPPLVINADGRVRKLAVTAPGYLVYKTSFIANGKDKTIKIRMVRRRYRWRSMRPMRPRTGPGIIVRPMY